MSSSGVQFWLSEESAQLWRAFRREIARLDGKADPLDTENDQSAISDQVTARAKELAASPGMHAQWSARLANLAASEQESAERIEQELAEHLRRFEQELDERWRCIEQVLRDPGYRVEQSLVERWRYFDRESIERWRRFGQQMREMFRNFEQRISEILYPKRAP